MQSPPIDARSYTDLVTETEQLAQRSSAWRPSSDGRLDAGSALIRIFSHFAELVVERLNRVPARNQLAFLNLIGTPQLPARPARVPLTFTLANGSAVDAAVPAATPASAAPLPKETDDVVFETERDLVVTRSTLGAVFVSDTETDTYSDRTAEATGQLDQPFEAFRGDTSSPHHLYVAVEPRSERNDLTLELRTPDIWQWTNWPIVWEFWDGGAWKEAVPTKAVQAGVWRVVLPGVPELPAHTVDGIEAGWVRARLAQPLSPDETGLQPEWVAVGNRNPQPLTSGLLVFGETGQRFYLSASEPFAAGGARVRLQFRLATPGSSADVQLSWTYHDGTDWRTLGQSGAREARSGASPFDLRDGTRALTSDGDVSFHVPPDWPRTLYRTRGGRWLRVEVSSGVYATAPVFATIEIAHEWELPHLTGISVDGRAPLAVRSYNDFIHRDDMKTPFAPTADRDPALYLGLDRPFDARPIALYLRVEPPRPEQVAADELAEIDPEEHAVVVWEYDGPDGWQPLGAVDETQAMSRSGLISFAGPQDFTERPRFGHARYWLRARWMRGAFLLPPRLRRILLNTMWASEAVTVKDAILGSSNGNPGQVFTTAQSPVLDGQRLVVRERNEPAGPGQPTDQEWVLWEDRRDLYESGPRDRHYIIDRLTGEIRFGDGVSGMIPPTGQNNVRVTYRTGGGERGNREAGAIVELKRAVPYVDAVVNHEPAQGGAAIEPIERLEARGPRALRHRDRAITAEDLEDLAMASPAVARARAVVPAFNPYDLWLDEPAAATEDHLAANAGRMGVIVVPDDGTDRPTPTLGLLREVQAYVGARCPTTAEVWVAGPEWISVRVDATVAPMSLVEADAVGVRVRQAIERFLHPLTGGMDGQGWAFGRKPHRSDLLAVAAAVDGVEHVAALTIGLEPQTGDPERMSALQRMLDRPMGGTSDRPQLERDLQRWLDRALVYSGRHEISVVP